MRSMVRGFTRVERAGIEAALARDRTPVCPACGGALARSPVPASPDVAYVRRRVLFVCTECGRGGAIDVRADEQP
ncbi:MAG: hypothetical protein ACRELV_10645 [Longimicrobiales bacterium]